MPRRIKTNPNDLPDAEKLLVSVSGTLEVIYKTLAELDIAKKSDVDSELSNKEPSITAGSDTQYWRGDKTFQTLDAAAVAETEGRVFLSPEQKTVATQAASSSQSGYLTSADWSTFNDKQAALVSGTNIKTVNGNSLLGNDDLVVGEQSVVLLEQDGFQTLSVGKRHYLPYITTPYTLNLNAPTGAAIGDWFILESRQSALDGVGLSTFLLGINLKMASGEYVIGYGDIISPDTLPLLDVHNNSTNSPNFTNGCSFRFTKVTATGWSLQPTYGAVMPAKFQMKVSGTGLGGTFFASTAVAGSYATVTLPPIDANLGDLPSVATNDNNSLSGTAVRCRILGGSGNTVSGTDNVILASSNCTVSGTGNTVIGGDQCNNNVKTGTVLRGRKAIAYTDFEQVDCTYFGTAHNLGSRQFYDRFAPNIRTYNTYMFGDISDLSVQNFYSLAFKPKAVIGLSTINEPAAAFHKIRIVALKMGGTAGAASMEVSLMCRSLNGVYTIVERVDSAIVGTAGIMSTFTFSIDSNGYLIIQKTAQTSDWGYFIYGKAYHTATQ